MVITSAGTSAATGLVAVIGPASRVRADVTNLSELLASLLVGGPGAGSWPATWVEWLRLSPVFCLGRSDRARNRWVPRLRLAGQAPPLPLFLYGIRRKRASPLMSMAIYVVIEYPYKAAMEVIRQHIKDPPELLRKRNKCAGFRPPGTRHDEGFEQGRQASLCDGGGDGT